MFAMERLIVTLSFVGVCLCDWVLIPVINSKENVTLAKNPLRFSSNTSAHLKKHESRLQCPDFHNLTVMSFAKSTPDDSQPLQDLDISMDDVQNLINENQKIPKTSPGKANFMARMGENLMNEAEMRIKSLFHTGRREARFSSFHFPTMEGSLMTISMLLFGVYLSKLIVKLLQSHYTKYNMPIRMMGGIRKPILMTQNRRTRSIESDIEKIHFLSLIDNYHYQFN